MSDEAKDAPHGRNEDGTPKTPYGINVDGTPRKSNRGARRGQKGNGAARKVGPAKTSNMTDKKRREMLIGLTDMMVVTPLAGLSLSPQVEKRIGKTHTDALAGDAVILSHFSPGLADGLIMLSQSKPSALAWLDSVEDKAPYLLLAQVGVQVAKALISNHTTPNPELAQAGRVMAAMKVQAMADEINREADAMGVTVPESAQDAA